MPGKMTTTSPAALQPQAGRLLGLDASFATAQGEVGSVGEARPAAQGPRRRQPGRPLRGGYKQDGDWGWSQIPQLLLPRDAVKKSSPRMLMKAAMDSSYDMSGTTREK